MVFMNAGMLDHRNIGSNITLPDEDGTVSGAIALIVQHKDNTEIHLAHDEISFEVARDAQVDVALPPAAAYTLGLKNIVEDLAAKLNNNAG
jgi:hypothetical protein